ncbi:MAG TPA: hypothetical protein VJN20_06095 [Burkholderiales bacterium]|nr:hypothetical protein [Burkholderiales bacterium]
MRAATFLLVLALGGCAGAAPFEYRAADEIPEGPGLLTGKDGAFTLRTDYLFSAGSDM